MTIKYLLQIFLVPISLVLYFNSPLVYSEIHCNIYLSIFLISSINLLLNNLKENIFLFELFFTVAFFFTIYVYPTFYYLNDPFFSLFQLPFNEAYITKATALATLGITSFNLGIFQYKHINKKFYLRSFYVKKVNTKKRLLMKFFLVLLFLIFIYNMQKIISQGFYTMNWGTINLFVFEILIFLIYFFIFIELKEKSEKSFFYTVSKCNKILLIIILASILLLLYIGSRTIPMRLTFFTLCIYSYFYKPISIKYFLPIFIGGFLLMFIIGQYRSSSEKQISLIDNFSNIRNLYDIGNELTINNRSLYVLMEHADKNGISYGANFLMNIFSVVPLMQSFVLNNFDIKLSDISSGNLVTDQIYSAKDPDRIGLGTNLIGDIYIAFGTFGVILLMYILGNAIKIIHAKAVKKDPKYILIYGLILMDAIYYTRSSYLTPLRNIAWVLIIYKLDSLRFNNTSNNK